MTNHFILARIQSLQYELKELEKILLGHPNPSPNVVKLQGIWEKVIISDEEVDQARLALFDRSTKNED